MVSSTISSTIKKTSPLITWKSTGMLQKTVNKCIQKWGVGLHSGNSTTVNIWPELAGKGRFFDVGSTTIGATIDYVDKESMLCTTLCKDGYSVRTVEHLLSALEATGVDNCRLQIIPSQPHDPSLEVPILDGSAIEWVKAIEEAGVTNAVDENGNSCEKMAPFLNEPVHLKKNDGYLEAFPASDIHISYGIDFPKVPCIGCQWFYCSPFKGPFYAAEIASSRTFCVYEEVERMRDMGLIKGGSLENAIVCSASTGWLNPSLRFVDEPCRHKVLDIIGDLSMLARPGSQGFPIAHIIAYKAGHSLHADLVRYLAKHS